LDHKTAVVVLKDDIVGSRKTQSAHSDKVAVIQIDNSLNSRMGAALARSPVEHATTGTGDLNETATRIHLQKEFGRGNLIAYRNLSSAPAQQNVPSRCLDKNDACRCRVQKRRINYSISVERNGNLYINVLSSGG